jgi:hypothetical protein
VQIDVIGTCMGDVSVDNRVDSDDLITVLGSLGACAPGACIADLTHDGQVDFDDVLSVILRWGACP